MLIGRLTVAYDVVLMLPGLRFIGREACGDNALQARGRGLEADSRSRGYIRYNQLYQHQQPFRHAGRR